MKKLLTKFRLSNAIDDKSGEPLPGHLREAVDASPELKDFSQQAGAVDRALRKRPGTSPSDAALHQSIMRAVRSSEQTQEGGANMLWRRGADALPWTGRFGLVTVSTGLAVVAIAIWVAVRPATPGTAAKSREQSLEVAQVVIDVGGQLPQSVPSVMSPLTNELACVDHDIQDTTKFVMAMLPSY